MHTIVDELWMASEVEYLTDFALLSLWMEDKLLQIFRGRIRGDYVAPRNRTKQEIENISRLSMVTSRPQN